MMRAARALCRGRFLVLAAWLAAGVVCAVSLPTIDQARSGAVGGLYPKDAGAIKAEITSKTQFGFPLLSRTLVVQRDPGGLSAARQARIIERAADLTRHRIPGFGEIAAALPVTNALGASPFARERSTTAVTYLFFDPGVRLDRRVDLAHDLVRDQIGPGATGTVTGVTGQSAAVGEQSRVIVDRLPIIELATFVLVALAVGVRFRALGAPALTLGAVAVAYVVSSRVVAGVGQHFGVAVPQEVEPVIVVLLFGIVTDYSIFYLSRFRALLADGVGQREAAVQATAQLTPIIATAGIAVVAATGTLLAARLEFLRVFGPGLAFAVLIGLLVSLTLVPACLAIFGRALYWPRLPRAELSAEESATGGQGRPRRSRAVRLACGHPWWAVGICVALLAAAASGLGTLQLANPIVRGLPEDSEPRVAYEAAAKGFAPGVLSPTVIVVSSPGITRRRGALARLQRAIGAQRGVALVLGPTEQPVPGVRLGATLARDRNAARYFIVLRDDPLGARAIADLRRIEDRMPVMLEASGLPRAEASFAGDTALSAETIDKTLADLGRIAPLTLLALFLVLAVYLRAIVAPLFLIAASVLGFCAALGLGAYVFGELTYFVPFAAAALLVSLGSDYNVFLIGRIWQERSVRPLKEAVPTAASRAAKAITLAGVVLAGSFALIGIVPLRSFAELALIMTFGLLIDALVIRTVLVPALLMLVGETSGWPGRHLAPRPSPSQPR